MMISISSMKNSCQASSGVDGFLTRAGPFCHGKCITKLWAGFVHFFEPFCTFILVFSIIIVSYLIKIFPFYNFLIHIFPNDNFFIQNFVLYDFFLTFYLYFWLWIRLCLLSLSESSSENSPKSLRSSLGSSILLRFAVSSSRFVWVKLKKKRNFYFWGLS